MLTFCDPVQRRDGRDELVGFFNLSDALNITWMHATNSPEKLQEGLTGDYMMLEADVLMRSDDEPIMAHPPASDSNLTLKEFLGQTLFSSRGFKLDFKTVEAVEPSLKILLNMTIGKNIKNPIWVNADILVGPCYTPSKCNPVNAQQFLDLTKHYVPNFTLSIGWKTQFDAAYHYNWSFVIPMGQLLVDISQPVTFPIRYSLVGRSLDQLEWLMDLSETFTLTIWSSASDEVSPKDLAFLRLDMIPDRRRIYYDLPVDQMTDFMKELETYKKQTIDKPFHVIKVNWRGYTTTACTSILIGQSSIMFTEQGGWASTDKENKPARNTKTSYTKYIVLSASVVFIDDNKSGVNQNVSFVLHSAGLEGNQENHSPLTGTRAVLQSDGNFELVTTDGALNHSSVASSSTYQVKVTDIGDGEVWFEVKPGGTDEHSWQKLSGHDEGSKSFYTLIGTLQQPGAVLVKNLQMSTVEGMLTSGAGGRLFTRVSLVFSLAAVIAGLLMS